MHYCVAVPLQSAELILEFASHYEVQRAIDPGDYPRAVGQAFGFVKVSVSEVNPADPLAMTIKKQAVSKSKFEDLILENTIIIAKLFSMIGQLDTQLAMHTIEGHRLDPKSDEFRRLRDKKAHIDSVKSSVQRRMYAHEAFSELIIRDKRKTDSVKFDI